MTVELAITGPLTVVTSGLPRELMPLWAVGLAAGLLLFWRGLAAYRLGSKVATIATSTSQGLAVGEVRASGTVEPGPTMLVSPLQSARCVYYGSRVTVEGGRAREVVLDDARSVAFRLRDGTGTVWVFPRGARWQLEPRLDARSGLDGEPPTLDLNRGPAEMPGAEDREAQIARLLTVQDVPQQEDSLFARTMGGGWAGTGGIPAAGGFLAAGLSGLLETDAGASLGGGRHYGEERVEPGDVVTIVATAMPFSQVGDAVGAADADPLDDPEIAGDLAAARSTGALRARPRDTWGNAAIPGFGIGRPTREPALDPAATPEPVVPLPATAGGAAEAGTGTAGVPVASGAVAGGAPSTGSGGLDIAPDELVLAAGSGHMLVYAGTPVEAAGSETTRFWKGVGGAVLAIVCAAILVLQVGGR